MARQVRGYLLVGNSENALESFNKEKSRFQEAANRAENLIKSQNADEQLQKLRRTLELASQFDELSKKTFRTVDEGKQKEAIALYLPESKIILGESNHKPKLNSNQFVLRLEKAHLDKVWDNAN